MAADLPGVRVLRTIREDAVGAWLAVEKDGASATLRTLREEHVAREDVRLLFAEEARRISGLADPLLLRVIAQDPRAARPWILTEPIDGETLEERVARSGPLASEEARALARSLARALGHLASRRQVHAGPWPSRLVRVGDGWRLLTFRDVRAADEARRLKGKTGADRRFAPPETDAGHPEPVRAPPLLAWGVGALWRFAAGLGEPRDAAGRPRPLAGADPVLARRLGRLLDPAPLARPPDPEAVLALLDAEDPDAPPPPPAAPVPRRRRP